VKKWYISKNDIPMKRENLHKWKEMETDEEEGCIQNHN
jgi:hypothetical protein